jgi:hypothetical protein
MRVKRPGRILIVLAAIVCLAAFAFPTPAGAASAPAQTDPLQLDVIVGFDGYIQDGTWTPINVIASNDGSDVSGELRVEVESFSGTNAIYSRRIDLPQGSRKQVTFYAADVSTYGGDVQVDLVADGHTLTSQRTRISRVHPSTLLIGVWSDVPQGLADLAKVTPTSEETRIALLTVDDIPDNVLGWQALDVLAIADVDSGQLSAAQREAMREWVASGGRLLIVGGVGFQRTLAGLDAVMPVRAETTVNASVAPLAGLAGPGADQLPDSTTPVAAGELAEGTQVLAESDSIPLVVTRELGYGNVYYFAADPSLAPLAGWEGMPDLWQAILSTGEPLPAWAYGFSDQWSYARQAVATVPGVKLPSVLQLCGFLALYVILIGPVNFIVLSRLKRRELAWITIPGLILLFSGMAYVTGFQLRGSRAILHRLAVIRVPEDAEVQRVDSLLGVWSPRRARYDVALPEGFLAYPMQPEVGGALAVANRAVLEEGEHATLQDVRVDVGAVQPFVVEGSLEGPPPATGRLTLTLQDDALRVTGEVENLSSMPLQDGVLNIGGTVIELPDLEPGASIEVDEKLQEGRAARATGNALDPYPVGAEYYYPEWDNPLIEAISGGECFGQSLASRRCNLFMSILNGQPSSLGATVFYWAEEVPFSTEIVGGSSSNTDLALYAIDLETTLAPVSQGRVDVPPGLTSWQNLDDTYPYATPYDIYLYPGDQFTFHFEPLPLVGDLMVESFILHLATDVNGGGYAPTVQIRNVQSGRWEAQREIGYGDYRIEDVDRYVDGVGGVEIRLFGNEDAFGGQVTNLSISYSGVVTPEE